MEFPPRNPMQNMSVSNIATDNFKIPENHLVIPENPSLNLTLSYPNRNTDSSGQLKEMFIINVPLPENFNNANSKTVVLERLSKEIFRANELSAEITAEIIPEHTILPGEIISEILAILAQANNLGSILGNPGKDIETWRNVQEFTGLPKSINILDDGNSRLTYFASKFETNISKEKDNILKYLHLDTGRKTLKIIFDFMSQGMSQRDIAIALNGKDYEYCQEFNGKKFTFSTINKLYKQSAGRLEYLRPNTDFLNKLKTSFTPTGSSTTSSYLRIDPKKENEEPESAITIEKICNVKATKTAPPVLENLPLKQSPFIEESNGCNHGFSLKIQLREDKCIEKDLMLFIFDNNEKIVYSKKIDFANNNNQTYTIDLYKDAGLLHGYYTYLLIEEGYIHYSKEDFLREYNPEKNLKYIPLQNSFTLGGDVYRLKPGYKWSIVKKKGNKVIQPVKTN